MQKGEEEKYVKHFLSDFYTKKEANTVLTQLKKGTLDKELCEVWDKTESIDPPSEMQKAQYTKEALNITREENPIYRKTFRKYIGKTVAAVASIAILITVGIVSKNYFSSPEQSSVAHIIHISTSFGETKSVLLSDGTHVTLNACSNLDYPSVFSGKQRNVQLTGEAFFDVKTNPKSLFIINTEQFDVKVLGTAFNVKAYQKDEIQSVTVERGKVQVDMADAMTRLSDNEGIVLNRLHNEHYKIQRHHQMATWREGTFQFDKTPISDVARELERAFDYKIDFEKGQIFDNLISGEHSRKNLVSILRSIELTSGIHYKQDEVNRRIILYK